MQFVHFWIKTHLLPLAYGDTSTSTKECQSLVFAFKWDKIALYLEIGCKQH